MVQSVKRLTPGFGSDHVSLSLPFSQSLSLSLKIIMFLKRFIIIIVITSHKPAAVRGQIRDRSLHGNLFVKIMSLIQQVAAEVMMIMLT